MFGYLGLIKPLWLDELFSLQIIENDSPIQIVAKLYKGSDTNSPLYFVLLKFYTFIFGTSDLSLKLFSFCLTLAAIIILYKIVKLLNHNSTSQLIVLTFVLVSQTIATYLMVEVRMYSLYFLLSNLLVYYYLKIDSIDFRQALFITLLVMALLYTHYYSFYLIFSIMTYELLTQKRKKVLISIAFGILVFLPWIPAIFNQFQIGRGLIYQSQPNLGSNFYQYFFLIGKGGVIILALLALFYFLIVKKIKMNNQIILAFIISSVPLVNILLSYLHLSVQVPRYFIFSLIGLTMIFSFTLDKLIDNKFIGLLIVFLLTVFTLNRLIYYKNFIEKNKTEIENILKLSKNNLVVCESPHKQYPLDHYSSNSNVLLLLDSISAFSKGNIKNAPYDYYLLSNYKKFYSLENILHFDDFVARNKKFLLINEDDRMLYEVRFRNNPNYTTKVISKNMLLIEQYEI